MKHKCQDCFDTGCRCGGIGFTCHGCCSCEEGTNAQTIRTEALKEIISLAKRLKTNENLQT